jgi:hypothetical protein
MEYGEQAKHMVEMSNAFRILIRKPESKRPLLETTA